MPHPPILDKSLAVELDVDTRARVENLAQARHQSADWILREAVTQYIDREEQREAFRQDTIKAWEEYKETGQHVDSDEVANWLASWGTDKEEPAPLCRG